MMHSDKIFYLQWWPRASQKQDRNLYYYTFQRRKHVRNSCTPYFFENRNCI